MRYSNGILFFVFILMHTSLFSQEKKEKNEFFVRSNVTAFKIVIEEKKTNDKPMFYPNKYTLPISRVTIEDEGLNLMFKQADETNNELALTIKIPQNPKFKINTATSEITFNKKELPFIIRDSSFTGQYAAPAFIQLRKSYKAPGDKVSSEILKLKLFEVKITYFKIKDKKLSVSGEFEAIVPENDVKLYDAKYSVKGAFSLTDIIYQ